MHDFVDPEQGRAIPYGIYDVANDEGWVSVGDTADTAEFAVNSIRSLVERHGPPTASLSHQVVVTADAGGSNGYRVRAWKFHLARLAVETGLEITVCHYPPGTSKWNRIEHRMFSFITMNWRGRPLTSATAPSSSSSGPPPPRPGSASEQTRHRVVPHRRQDHR